MKTTGSSYPNTIAVPLDVAVRDGEEGEWVAWRVRAPGNIDYGFARGDHPEGCLAAFLELEKAPLAQFASFVRKWGVLGICSEHRLPGVHNSCSPRQGENVDELFPRTSLTEGWTVPLRIYQEPIERWRTLAGTLSATVRIGQCLKRGEQGKEADLSRLFGEDAAKPTGTQRSIGEQRIQLGGLINGWLSEIGTTPVFTWPFASRVPQLTLDIRGAGPTENGFDWPARSLYPELLNEIVEEMANP